MSSFFNNSCLNLFCYSLNLGAIQIVANYKRLILAKALTIYNLYPLVETNGNEYIFIAIPFMGRVKANRI